VRVPTLRDNLFHVTGTDIVRSLTYRFYAFGRPVTNTKKFEEGIFSDLRNLKPGTDATLEEPKSEFLDLLYKNNCIRTQKKQKVFYWFSVPHDRLFLDALERDLKREKMGQEPTTRATSEPALSFYYDSSMTLFDQLTKAVQQSNSSVGALSMSRPRTQSMDYQSSQSRTHSRQASELMPPPQMQMQPQDDYSAYIMQENQLQDLDPAVSIVQRTMESTPFAPVPYDQQSYRSAAMSCPPFAGLEYSPAPSFHGPISGNEYAHNRAMTYAPETPPQANASIYSLSSQMHPYGLLPTPEASVTDDMYPHGIVSPDDAKSAALNAVMRARAPSLSGPGSEQIAALQGSPTYKQRRRRTSISQHLNMINGVPTTGSPQFGHRPRAVSVAEGSLRNSLLTQGFQRHSTPIRDSPYQRPSTPSNQPLSQSLFAANDELAKLHQEHDDRFPSASPMPVDMRASATPGSGGDSPAKTFTCPVKSCGRLFKRLEHLKRHVRTHTQERPYVCNICGKKFSRSDNLAQYSLMLTFANCRHRKTHDRTGATHSPSGRNTPCDSTRNTPVSGDEDVDALSLERMDHNDHFKLYAAEGIVEDPNHADFSQSHPYHHVNHFRSISLDGHLSHYMGPPSHTLSGIVANQPATPPNEVDEHNAGRTETGPSPTDSDASHSYDDDAPQNYAHQNSYQGISPVHASLSMTPSGEAIPNDKHDMMLQADPLRKEYINNTNMLDPSLISQGWTFQ